MYINDVDIVMYSFTDINAISFRTFSGERKYVMLNLSTCCAFTEAISIYSSVYIGCSEMLIQSSLMTNLFLIIVNPMSMDRGILSLLKILLICKLMIKVEM